MSILKRHLPKSLFGRALIIIVAPLILVQIVALFVFYDRVLETLTRRLADSFGGDVGMIADLVERYPQPEERAWIFINAYRALGIEVHFRPRETLDRTTPDDGSGILERLLVRGLEERVGRPFNLDAWSQPRDVEVRVQLVDGVLVARTPRGRLFSSTANLLVIWTIGSSLVFFAIASLFMRNQVRPIRRLAQAADEFGKGRDSPGFHASGAAEVRQAANAFIVMRERIRRFLAQRTEMLAGVSHDLRTPLTRMKLELAMLPEHPSVAGLKTDVADMERMVDSYLAFVRGEGEERAEPIDLAALLGEIVRAAQRDGDGVTLAVSGDLTLPLRPQAMKRCLANLIANARRHAAQVQVAAARHDQSVEVTIDDDGPGIPEEAREDVFKPFYRLDASRNPATGGVGLGLTIARDTVRGHGGDIALDASPLGGLRARIRLPV